MQQSKAYVIKAATRNLKASIAARKAEYVAYRYGSPQADGQPNARRVTLVNAGGRNGH
jgi:hypothetical protein